MSVVSVPPATLPPPLKWAGGKRWLVPTLQHYWASHRHRRFVEPFVGGVAVFLGLRPAHALLNDTNPHLVNFYRWLQQGLQIDTSMENDREHYYQQRAYFNSLILQQQYQSSEAAALFYYLNRTCYNGLCRFNRRGLFNVPFGRYRSINYTRDFRSYQPLLARVTISGGDFASIPLEPGDFIYADPPYDVEFTSYSAGGFRWEDQVRVAKWLAAHPGPVIASNQATPRIIELYQRLGFELAFVDAPRRISRTGDRTPAREILAMKGLS